MMDDLENTAKLFSDKFISLLKENEINFNTNYTKFGYKEKIFASNIVFDFWKQSDAILEDKELSEMVTNDIPSNAVEALKALAHHVKTDSNGNTCLFAPVIDESLDPHNKLDIKDYTVCPDIPLMVVTYDDLSEYKNRVSFSVLYTVINDN